VLEIGRLSAREIDQAMKPKNLQRLLALNLKPETLAEVLAILADECAPLEKRREKDRVWRAKHEAEKRNPSQAKRATVEIRVNSPQWYAWEKFKGRSLPAGRNGTWEVESEWPPGYGPDGNPHQ
jgi:hypothetical protein